ncbi:unnamed protein product [Allacma fusca]|uniref:Uncharacterized protein n=1 Tax=Allacma fusca TaxID=39272 RepID=A0A8J2M7X8_9HEXA|nr:unnamed protein product [Allacma fusca]
MCPKVDKNQRSLKIFVQRFRNTFKTQSYSVKVPVQDRSEKIQRNKMSSNYSPSVAFVNVSGKLDVERPCRTSGLITSYPCSSPRSTLSSRPTSFLGEDFDSDANLHLEKLQIRPPEENSPRHRSFSPQTSYGPSVMMSPSFMRGDHLMPLWKDYPMVHKAVPSSQSYCSMPLSSYPNSGYGSPAFIPPNYRSSSMASIFGGPKPIISPPKLDVGFTSRYDLNVSASPAYLYHSGNSRHSWTYGMPSENVMPPYLTSPLSRSSSQSSGFVSQKEFNTPPPSSPSLPTPLNAHVAFGDPDKCVDSELQIGTNSHRTGGFISKDFASFSSLNNSNSVTASEMNLRQGRIWSPPTFVSFMKSSDSSVNNTSRNTCSRFARKEAAGSCLRRSNDIKPVNSSLYSDDDDDDGDNESFVSARTSMTHRTKTGNSLPASAASNDFVRSKSKIRSGPYIRNLRSTTMFEDESARSGQRDRRLQQKNRDEQDSSHCSSLWSLIIQLFWSLSVFFNVVLMFWLFFGNPYDAQESHWVHHVIHNMTDAIMTNTPILWDSLQQSVLNMLAAREVDSSVNPTILILNDYEL